MTWPAAALGCSAQESAAGRDPDLPFPNKALWPAVLVVVGLGFLGDTALTELFNVRNHMRYPRITVDGDGAYRLVRSEFHPARRRVGYWFVDDRHQNVAPARDVPLADASDAFLRVRFRGNRWPGNLHRGDRLRRKYHSSWFDNQGDLRFFTTYTHAPLGYMRHYLVRRGPAYETVTLGRGAEDQPFSIRARAARIRGIPKFVVGDPEDGGIWVCDFAAELPRYERVALPDGDRFKRFASISSELEIQLQDLVGETTDLGGDPTIENVVIGERHAYAFDPRDNSVESLTGELAARYDPSREKTERGDVRYGVWVDKDPIHPRAEVRDGTGAVVFTHQYAPHRANEWFNAMLLCGQSLLRSPATQVYGFATTREFSLVSAGDYPWLLLAHLALAVLLSSLAKRRLRGLGAAPAHQWFWALAILLGGVLVAAVCRVIETNRACRPCRVLPKDEIPLTLIQSA